MSKAKEYQQRKCEKKLFLMVTTTPYKQGFVINSNYYTVLDGIPYELRGESKQKSGDTTNQLLANCLMVGRYEEGKIYENKKSYLSARMEDEKIDYEISEDLAAVDIILETVRDEPEDLKHQVRNEKSKLARAKKASASIPEIKKPELSRDPDTTDWVDSLAGN